MSLTPMTPQRGGRGNNLTEENVILQGSFGSGLRIIDQVALLMLVSVVSGAIVYIIKSWYDERQERGQTVEDMAITLYGVEGVNTVEGLVDIMESHDRTLDQHREKIEELKEKMDEIEGDVESNTEKIRSIRERVSTLAERCKARDPNFGDS